MVVAMTGAPSVAPSTTPPAATPEMSASSPEVTVPMTEYPPVSLGSVESVSVMKNW